MIIILLILQELREFIKEKLPEYMIPSAFVILDQLPLTPNGKVDRKSLPEPDQRPEDYSTYVPPRTIIEKHLVEIWKQILGLQQIGIFDNFFELGGHSILTIRVVSLAQQAGLTLNIKLIFKYSSISLLSSSLIQEEIKKNKKQFNNIIIIINNNK